MAAGELKINISANAQQAVQGFKSTAIAAKDAGQAILDAREKVETLTAKLYLLNQQALKSSVGKTLASELKNAKSELKDLETQAGITGQTTTNVFSTAFGAVRRLAYILPGIGVAGIFGIVIAGATELAQALFNTSTKAEFLRDKISEMAAAVDKAQAATAGERSEVLSLVSIAENEALSRDARTEALKKLQKEYPSYFGNIKFDGQLTDNLRVATDKLTNSILLNAKAKAIQKQIDESANRVAEAANEGELTVIDKAKGFLSFQFGGFAASQIKLAELATKNYNATVDKETELQKELAKQLTAVNTELAVKGTLFEDKLPKLKKIKEAKEAVFGFAQVLRNFNEANEIAAGTKTLDIGKTFGKTKKDDFGPLQLSPDTQKAIDALTELRNKMQLAEEKSQEFNKTLNSALNNIAVDGLTSVAEGIAKAFSGGNINDILGGFVRVLGEGLKAIGQAAIAYGVSLKAIKLAFKNPATAIAAGIGLILAGTLLESVIAKRTAFAEGGIVTGPTNALIGEAGPEVVFPLNKLNNFIKGIAGGGMQVEFLPLQTYTSSQGIYQLYQAHVKKVNRGLSG